jgi:hypothetical protein
MLISQCVDFPGTGEDEISFKKGDIIAVIARDDGFGDGWWTVIPLLSQFMFFLFPNFHIFMRFDPRFTLRRWAEVGKWAVKDCTC